MVHASQYYYTSYVAMYSDGKLKPFYYIPGQGANSDTNSGHAYYGVATWFVNP